MTLVILWNEYRQSKLGFQHFPKHEPGKAVRMSETAKPVQKGSDWTRLLTDPDLVSHLGKLLQTYREVAPEQREAALLRAMREIKEAAIRARGAQQNQAAPAAPVSSTPPAPLPTPMEVTEAPPFEPDLFSPLAGSDRRRFARIKCHVAVEIHVEGIREPVWGNLANVGRGGCLVETASAVPAGKVLEIGLWVSSGKIWVKGVILSGVVIRSAPSFGVRVKFSEAELSEKEHLREFLRFVETSARKSQSGNAYMAGLKG
jgi:PilZ domain